MAAASRPRDRAQDLVQRLQSLSPAKRKLLIQRHPLSFSQRRLWFLEQLYGDKALYNGANLLGLRGQLDVRALARVMGEIIRRHRVLDTAFPAVDGQPVQWPLPWQPRPLPMVDLSRLALAVAQGQARRLCRIADRRPFDLQRGPMFELWLLRLEPRHHFLLYSAHHIVSDRWSQAVFVREMTCLYHAFHQGQPSPLAEPKLQYLDFARWQHKRLQGERLEHGLAWWRRQLDGIEPLELRTDRPRPARLTFEGRRHAFLLRDTSTARLDAACARLGMTPFMLGLSVFALLLERYSGRRAFLLGSVVAGRDRVELEELIGFFVATLVLPWGTFASTSATAPEPRAGRGIDDLLEEGRRCVLAVQEHADIPFEMLVEQLRPQRDPARHPLFQVVFAVHNTPSEQLQLGELQLEAPEEERRTSRMDLLGTLETFGPHVFFQVEFSTELFDATTVRRFAGHFERLLDGVLTAVETRVVGTGKGGAPTRDVETLEFLSTAEREQLLRQWQDTARPYASDDSVHLRLYRQATRRPDALALVHGRHHISFDTLCRRAAALAAHLHRVWPRYHEGSRLGPEAIVAVCLPRSTGTVLAQLAILHSGAAFLQLDPSLPAQRLRWLLADSGARGVLTEERLWQRLQQPEAAALAGGEAPPLPPWLDIEAWLRSLSRPAIGPPPPGPDVEPPRSVQPESLAYVIYTSGSTGRPKGVEVSHGSLANLVSWYHASFDPGPDDRASQTFGLGFDGIVFEVWSHLSAGVCLDLLDLRALSAADFGRWLRRRGISLVMLVTPLTEQLLRVPWPRTTSGGLTGPRAVLTGGDALHGPPPPGYPFRVFNLYGPTETTVIATSTDVPPAAAISAARRPERPSIGRPLSNLRARILDAAGRLLPIGVQGELHIGGPSVARGYHDRPRLTAEKFVPDAWAETAGERLYATGDLARFLPDGRIDFLGRRDHQVKIRGFRIEPDEVASQLRRHPRVEAAAVLARPGGRSRDLRLEAFVVLRATSPASDATSSHAGVRQALADHLRADLPDYMTPAVWHVLDALPLTINQKLDRRALEAIAAEADAVGTDAAAGGRNSLTDPDSAPAPRDDIELRVLELWQELLPGQPHLTSDFFAAGGHSLLAVRLMAEVDRRFGVELPLSTLFDAATPEAFAARLRNARSGGRIERPVCVALQRRASAQAGTAVDAIDRPLFLAHPVGGEVLCYLPLARRLADLCSVYGLQSPDHTEPGGGASTLEELASRYLDAVREVQPTGPYRLAGWSMGGLITFELARRLRQQGEEVEWIVLIDVRAPTLRRGDPHLEGEALRRVFEQDLAALTGRAPADGDLEGPFRRFAANYEALYAYGHAPVARSYASGHAPVACYEGTVHVWRAAEGDNADLTAPALGWAEWVHGRIEEATLPGDHYSLLQPPRVEETARRLRALLASREPAGPEPA